MKICRLSANEMGRQKMKCNNEQKQPGFVSASGARLIRYMNSSVKIRMQKQIYTYGPIIHNAEVVKDMEKKGVVVLQYRSRSWRHLTEGTVIIRSHGIEKRIHEKLQQTKILRSWMRPVRS